MDKTELKAGSKTVLFAVLVAAALLVGGCETAKGFAKDSCNLWNSLKKADAWVAENLW